MKILKKIEVKDILFIDIETSYGDSDLSLDSPTFDAWSYKKRRDNETDEELKKMYEDEAALYSDFGRVVCISVGVFDGNKLRVKTFDNFSEHEMIKSFYSMLDGFKGDYLCGHNIKSFDIPYIAKRGVVNNILPHRLLDTSGEKPWTMDWLLDTKELWQMGSFDRSSLIGLTNALGIDSPKQDLQGKDVPKYFWSNPKKNIGRISKYCERDVVAVYKIVDFLKNIGVDKSLPLEETPLIAHLFGGGAYGAKQKKELITIFKGMTEKERDMGYVILNSIVSTAKGKKTKLTKAHVKALKVSVDE